MANTIVNITKFANEVQMNLRVGTPAIGVCNTRYEAQLRKGQKMDNPYANPVRVQDYSYSTDAIIDPATLTSDQLTIDQVKVATVNYDPLQNLLTPEFVSELQTDMAYELARNINQYVGQTGVDQASSTVAGGALSAGTAFEFLTDLSTQLSRNRAGKGVPFLLAEPGFVALLAQSDVANGFSRADSALRQGYVGDTNAGFRVYECHDLPCTVTLTVDTQPTAGDTFTLLGYTWTTVADGATPTAGQVRVGADLADFKAIFVTLVNGTTPPSASDYVDVSVDQRRDYQNSQLTAAAFSGDDSVITSYGRIGAEETFTAATNVFGTESCSMLAGHMGAIDLVVQSAPEMEERKEPKNKSMNILGTTQYGAHTYNRNTKRIVKATFNV